MQELEEEQLFSGSSEGSCPSDLPAKGQLSSLAEHAALQWEEQMPSQELEEEQLSSKLLQGQLLL